MGKTVAGRLLAQRLSYDFYDLDEEVKKNLNTTLESFVTNRTLRERDTIRCEVINALSSHKGNKVIAITPLSYLQPIYSLLSSSDIFPIVLTDSVESIFDRLVFSDENDVIYTDDAYKNKNRNHYLLEISKDLTWYGSVYAGIKHHFHMLSRQPEAVVDALIIEYHLDGKEV
ncbi:shikimate kinase [Fusibacter sp. 3D3]|uniref:shikimate kinase n=1 Tax=Fusibacter sp. 3D3 TaxID=1048380 RepID=UPI0008539156|nr:shikimate kinase [Fusibacter sp. 3D3]GAU77719.1 hypothetical protein F3D3_2348 [Fusibacter sp. 3D3]